MIATESTSVTRCCGEPESSTLNLGQVKKKGIHRASTDCPPGGPPTSSGASDVACYSSVPMPSFRLIALSALIAAVTFMAFSSAANAQAPTQTPPTQTPPAPTQGPAAPS